MAQNKYRCQRTLYRDKTHCRIPLPAHDMQQRTLSQYGRMLGKRYGHFYDRGRYLYPLLQDPQEPVHVAESIALMKLSHAVVTSVDRDDLPDLGAAHWVQTIREIKRLNPDTTVEVLIPDFQGRKELVDMVIEARPEIISHNMETVKRISPLVRSAAHYETSLEVLRQISESGTVAKSGIMVGLGETPDEVAALMDDLRDAGCRILTIGQYLQPTHKHYPVAEYVTPAQFTAYKELGLKKGFTQVESAPLVRSSYHAEKSTQYLQKK